MLENEMRYNVIIVEQDIQLDHLSGTIAKQKEIGLLISNELDLHADLLDRTEANIDNTNDRVLNARRRLDRIIRGSSEKRKYISDLALCNQLKSQVLHL